MEATATVTGLVGVYHADGGALGEARYVVGRLLGSAHCALCDITHSPVRRKPAWDRMVADLGLPFELVHLNEMSAQVAAAAAQLGAPLVLARRRDGTVTPVLRPAELDGLGGSVEAFAVALKNALRALDPQPGDAVAPRAMGLTNQSGGHRE